MTTNWNLTNWMFCDKNIFLSLCVQVRGGNYIEDLTRVLMFYWI